MESLGFPTPFRKIVQVNLNGFKYWAIFQESLTKEFMERWSIRESPIIEFDERQLWSKRLSDKSIANPSHIGSKIINGSFIKNFYNLKIVNEAMINPIVQEDLSEYPKIDVWKKELFLSLNKQWYHGLYTHNLSFIYDPILKLYYPIYKEGLVKIEKCSKKIDNSLTNKEFQIIKTFEKRTKSKINKNEICFLKKINSKMQLFKMKKETFLSAEPEQNLKKINMIDTKDYNNQFFIYNNSKEIVEKCTFNEDKFVNCFSLNYENAKKHFKGDSDKILYNNQNVYPLFYKNKKNPKIKLENLKDEKITLKINSSQNQYYKVSKETISLDIFFEEKNIGNVVLTGDFNPNVRINLYDKRKKEPTNKDKNYITGCLTFLDVNFDGGIIKTFDAQCEDAVNIIRSIGKINKIASYNSKSDGIDFDFSNINIENLIVNEAGNDCSDFSFGKYTIKKAEIFNCGDKGVSVGEKSQLSLKNFIIRNSIIGVASKDSSQTLIKNGNIFDSKKYCLASYKKKKEFDGGQLIYENISCGNNRLFNDDFSIIIEQ